MKRSESGQTKVAKVSVADRVEVFLRGGLMKIVALNGRRRTLAYLFSAAMSLSILGGLRRIGGPKQFDVREHFSSYSLSQLRQMGLSAELARLVANFQHDVFARSFIDFDDLTVWLRDKIDAEYRLQRLTVHQRCIASHTEVALLISNFPHRFAES